MVKKGRRSKFKAEYPSDFVFDYKDPQTLYQFIMEGGKIKPSRISKLSNPQQREVNRAIKKARNLALLPLGNHAHDTFSRPDGLSATPFSID